MKITQIYNLLHCFEGRRECVYAKGIYVTNIPFARFTTIRFETITVLRDNHTQRQYTIVRNYFPVFVQFQRAWRRRNKWIKNPRRILARELYGIPIRPPPLRLHHQEYGTH